MNCCRILGSVGGVGIVQKTLAEVRVLECGQAWQWDSTGALNDEKQRGYTAGGRGIGRHNGIT